MILRWVLVSQIHADPNANMRVMEFLVETSLLEDLAKYRTVFYHSTDIEVAPYIVMQAGGEHHVKVILADNVVL